MSLSTNTKACDAIPTQLAAPGRSYPCPSKFLHTTYNAKPTHLHAWADADRLFLRQVQIIPRPRGATIQFGRPGGKIPTGRLPPRPIAAPGHRSGRRHQDEPAGRTFPPGRPQASLRSRRGRRYAGEAFSRLGCGLVCPRAGSPVRVADRAAPVFRGPRNPGCPASVLRASGRRHRGPLVPPQQLFDRTEQADLTQMVAEGIVGL